MATSSAVRILRIKNSAHFDFIPAPLRRHILALPVRDGARLYLLTLWWNWFAHPRNPVDAQGNPRVRLSAQILAKELGKSSRTVQEYRAELEKLGYLLRTADENTILILPESAMMALEAAPVRSTLCKDRGASPEPNCPAPPEADRPALSEHPSHPGDRLVTPAAPPPPSSRKSAIENTLQELLGQREALIREKGIGAYNLDRTIAPLLDSRINHLREQLRQLDLSPGGSQRGVLETHVTKPAPAPAPKPTRPERGGEGAQHAMSSSDLQRIVHTVHALWRAKKVSSPMELVSQMIQEITGGWVARNLPTVRHRVNVVLKLVREGRFRACAKKDRATFEKEMSRAAEIWRILSSGERNVAVHG